MNYEWYVAAYTATLGLSAAAVPECGGLESKWKICMAAQQERRRRPAKNNRHGTEGNPRPSRKTLAAIIRGIANDLSLTYSTCVTVQRALQSQNSDEDTEIGDCLRNHVLAALTRHVENLRDLAQSLHPTEETP
jgi:hypothetical protein